MNIVVALELSSFNACGHNSDKHVLRLMPVATETPPSLMAIPAITVNINVVTEIQIAVCLRENFIHFLQVFFIKFESNTPSFEKKNIIIFKFCNLFLSSAVTGVYFRLFRSSREFCGCED